MDPHLVNNIFIYFWSVSKQNNPWSVHIRLLLIDYIYSVVVDNLDKRDAYTTSRFKQNAVSHDNPICCVVQKNYFYKIIEIN